MNVKPLTMEQVDKLLAGLEQTEPQAITKEELLEVVNSVLDHTPQDQHLLFAAALCRIHLLVHERTTH